MRLIAVATGQQGYDPDDFIRRDRERDEREREQQRQDAMRDAMERDRQRRERDEMQRREEMESMRRLADVVNDPAIVVDQDMLKAINDPEMVMTNGGEVARVQRRMGLGTGAFAGQFNRGMGFDLPQTKTRKRKSRKNPKLAAAFREANRRYRTKSGKLRKGRTQADIARLAHRLLKRM